MDELIFGLLAAIFEIFAEAFLEIVLEAFVATIFRSLRNMVEDSDEISPVLATAVYLLLGSGFGMLSVFLLPHALVHRSRFHGVSLLISPVLTGLVMSQVGAALRRRGKNSVQIESFGYGFTFALGVAVIRFFFVKYRSVDPARSLYRKAGWSQWVDATLNSDPHFIENKI